jgi:hypothetical protein
MTDGQRQHLRTRLITDVHVLEQALLRHAPLPSEDAMNAQRLLSGLLKGAMASDDFTQALYALSYEIPLDVN